MKVHKPKNKLPAKTDIQIWAELKKGCTCALGDLYELYINNLFSYGVQFCKDRGYVMDCIHDLFFELYKYRTKLAMTDNVKSYLLKSLLRKINKRYSEKILPVQIHSPMAINNIETNHTASFEEDTIHSETSAEISAKLLSALESLTKKQKKGLFLKFDQGRSYEEIAEIMNTSIPTARTNIYRAIKMLRNQPFALFILHFSRFFS